MRVFLGSALALAVLVAGAWRADVHRKQNRANARMRQRVEDSNNLRNIASLAAFSVKLPMKDGAFDPYEFVRHGNIAGRDIKVLRSVRLGIGPTEEEAKQGHYGNFPWERYRGEPKPRDAPPYPLLWDKQPDEDGVVLVALSDGSVRRWDRKTLQRALAEAGVGR